jgi:hypothetical protein
MRRGRDERLPLWSRPVVMLTLVSCWSLDSSGSACAIGTHRLQLVLRLRTFACGAA